MRTRTKALLAGAGALLAAWMGRSAYVTRTAETVPYDPLGRFDGVDLRRYPRSVLVETTASTDDEAYRRLVRYVSGANAPGEDVSTTAPVRTVRNARAGADGTVTMAFYLPAEYTPETAPTPTDPGLRLVVEPPRTVATRRFSWYATDERVVRERRRLLDALADRGIDARGEPTLLRYDDPWTPPFVRRNEIAVVVAVDAD